MPSSRITLVLASIEDSDILFNWVNDPLTRRWSVNTDPVTREQHDHWLSATLNNRNRDLYIAMQDGTPVGTVRADFSNGTYELSWTVSPAVRGRGVGKCMVAMMADQLKGDVTARIKAGNTTSVRIAEHAGLKFDHEADGIWFFRRTIAL